MIPWGCQELTLLDAQECADVYRFLLDVKEMWHHRTPPEPFYTLGLAAYLDACDDAGREYYYANVRYPNMILFHGLRWLYMRIAARMSEVLGGEVRYRMKCAVPGFHIFTGMPQAKTSGIHYDRQHHQLTWSEADRVDFSQTVSFTLSIKLPSSGAGLHVWPQAPDDIPKDDIASWSRIVESYPSEFHPYTEGNMVIHAGDLPHKLAVGDLDAGGERITLQGHGLRCGEVWNLYW